MRLLLDTHAYLWWATDPTRLSPIALAACQNPSNELLLSIVSIWELMIKQGLGKLRLRHDVRTIVTRDLTQNRLALLHVTPDHLWTLDTLPHHHRDPFDRLLVAQAKVEALTLVSSDADVAKYDVNRLW